MKTSIRHFLRALLIVLSVACVPLGTTAATTSELKEESKGDLVLQTVPWVDGERLQLTLTLGSGIEIGTTEYRAMLVESNGRKVWRVGSRTFVQGNSLSWVDADAETFLPITSTWKHALLGEAAATFKPAEVKVTRPGKKDPSKFGVKQTVYDTEQSMHLMRRLPLAEGYQTTIPLVASLGGAAVIPVGLEVKEKEMIEVPAGKFECLKVELNNAQTFWFSTDAHRYLVKFEAGGATAVLASISQRKSTDPVPFQNDELGVTFTAPANWVLYQRSEEKPHSQVIKLLDPKAEADDIYLRLIPTESLSAAARTEARAWAGADVPEHLGKGLKDFKIRAESWKPHTVGGRPGVSVIADYGEKDKRKPLFAIYALGSKTSEQFVLMSAADKFEALKPVLESIVDSYRAK